MTLPPALDPASDAGAHLVIAVLASHELRTAATLLAEGMRDNPLHMRAFGVDVKRRQRRLRRFLGPLATYVHANGTLLGASVHGELIGVLGMMEPGRCRPERAETMRMATAVIVGNPPLGTWRIHRWLAAWERNDPLEPHAHVGPFAVSSAWRRQGVGRQMMMRCCRRLDALGQTAWLETDLAINAAFYQTLGFVVVRRESVLGVPNWFMQREPRTATA